MKDHRVQCTVDVPEMLREGVLANAFRLVADNPGEYLLDFIQVDHTSGTLHVVSRVRVSGHVMEAVRDRLHHARDHIDGRQGLTAPLVH
jgi:hypothetical protein